MLKKEKYDKFKMKVFWKYFENKKSFEMQKTLEKFDDKLRIVFMSGNKEESVKELTENRKNW